jgi:hypothetical protein
LNPELVNCLQGLCRKSSRVNSQRGSLGRMNSVDLVGEKKQPMMEDLERD